MDDYLAPLAGHPILRGSSSFTFLILSQHQLITATHPELRLLSLAALKTRPESHRQYSLLVPNPPSALPTGPVTTLSANPSERLLAVCSADQLAVLSLPRTEEHAGPSRQIECPTTPVRTEPGLPIAKLLWHPWSHRASTLLVLYPTGILHEFDIATDALHPAQTINFNSPYSLLGPPAPIASSPSFDGHPSLISSFQQVSLNPKRQPSHHPPSKSKPRLSSASIPPPARHQSGPHRSTSRGTYGAAHAASSTAVSICFGAGTGDWGPLTLYAIMLNGDMYAICPYLPKNAVIPLSYRNSLLFFLTAKLESIYTTAGTGKKLMDIQGPLEQSLDYLNSLSDVPDEPIDELDSEEEHGPEEGAKRNRRKERFKALVTPLRQGPFLLTPSPIETNENEEETVSDLLHFRYSALSSTRQRNSAAAEPNPADPNNAGVGVFVIAYQSRLDVCIEVEKIEPRWVPSSDANTKAGKPTTTTTTELPMLLTYESIDLHLRDGPSEMIRELSPLRMTLDVRYKDMIYVSHVRGLHVVLMQPWLEGLLEGEVDAGHKNKRGSLVSWLIQSYGSGFGIAGVSIVDDAYLGCNLLAFTDIGQLIPIPFSHRLAPPPAAAATADTKGPLEQLMAAPPLLRRSTSRGASGLLGEVWTVPAPLASNARGPGLNGPPPTSATTASAALKHAHEVSAQVDQYIRRLVEAINLGQDRLTLQIKEFQCQIRKLAHYPTCLNALNQHSQAQLGRIQAIERGQKALLKKADLVLQKLADDRNRILSREETRWFAELDRMALEVFGDPDGDRRGLKASIDQLKSQLEATKARLRADSQPAPGLEAGQGKSTTMAAKKTMGESQLVPIYHKLEQANGCLAVIHDQINKINKTLANKPAA
ncbi:hypothetical protein PtA15_1A925 [Puccinia triticina]|uniref:Uncharacterized protein n=1 Tax=Puccinia triticina TaxID=208348 RepID=A0ABY7CB21_9BASI|nr:uncharacterized protein PtA15_1A925 [Puccinia triticina]WAQ81583.1 hypothetical protein PtA15_1A925 [Puccinia triticina]